MMMVWLWSHKKTVKTTYPYYKGIVPVTSTIPCKAKNTSCVHNIWRSHTTRKDDAPALTIEIREIQKVLFHLWPRRRLLYSNCYRTDTHKQQERRPTQNASTTPTGQAQKGMCYKQKVWLQTRTHGKIKWSQERWGTRSTIKHQVQRRKKNISIKKIQENGPSKSLFFLDRHTCDTGHMTLIVQHFNRQLGKPHSVVAPYCTYIYQLLYLVIFAQANALLLPTYLVAAWRCGWSHMEIIHIHAGVHRALSSLATIPF